MHCTVLRDGLRCSHKKAWMPRSLFLSILSCRLPPSPPPKHPVELAYGAHNNKTTRNNIMLVRFSPVSGSFDLDFTRLICTTDFPKQIAVHHAIQTLHETSSFIVCVTNWYNDCIWLNIESCHLKAAQEAMMETCQNETQIGQAQHVGAKDSSIWRSHSASRLKVEKEGADKLLSWVCFGFTLCYTVAIYCPLSEVFL